MKTVEEYDKHLQDFYAQSFREYALKNGIDSNYRTIKAEEYANDMLAAYGEAFNKNIAQELLKKISMNSLTHDDKLNNYPDLFWKTESGTTLLKELANKMSNNEVQKLFNQQSLNLEDMTVGFKKVLLLAEKICFKNESEGLYLVKGFNMNLSKMIEYKIESKQIDNNTAQFLYNNTIKKVLTEDILEKEAFPQLQAMLHSMSANVKRQEEEKNPTSEQQKGLKLK